MNRKITYKKTACEGGGGGEVAEDNEPQHSTEECLEKNLLPNILKIKNFRILKIV